MTIKKKLKRPSCDFHMTASGVSPLISLSSFLSYQSKNVLNAYSALRSLE